MRHVIGEQDHRLEDFAEIGRRMRVVAQDMMVNDRAIVVWSFASPDAGTGRDLVSLRLERKFDRLSKI